VTPTVFNDQGQFSVNGQRADANYFTVDGVSADFGVTGYFPLVQAGGGALPALSVLGFSALAVTPTLVIIVIYQVLRRAGNFAFARPSREVLFTVVPREDKYKAKSFIDTVVYRTGDQVGAWSYAALSFIGLGMIGIAITAVPISIAWLVNGLWLGRKQETLASGEVKEATRPAG